jgi:hypothetical protein
VPQMWRRVADAGLESAMVRSALRLFFVTALVACGMASAFAEIVRCTGSSGGVTYQEAPCPASSVEKPAGIATEYPPPNLAERERLLSRESALYQRLEAQRERESKEAALRDARREREAELERARLAAEAAAQQPQYLLVYPQRHWRSHRPPVWRTLAPR